MAAHSAFEDSENRALAKIKETVRYSATKTWDSVTVTESVTFRARVRQAPLRPRDGSHGRPHFSIATTSADSSSRGRPLSARRNAD
jgi:hypothetical protein